MALTLVLLRHAKAKKPDGKTQDVDRPLSKRGRAAAPRTGAEFKRLGIRIDTVLCSPSKRTRETIELFAPEAGIKAKSTFEDELYLSEADDLIDRLRALPRRATSVLLVGHNPGLHELALELAADGDTLAMRALKEGFPTSALAVVALDIASWTEIAPQCGRLQELLFPRDLEEKEPA